MSFHFTCACHLTCLWLLQGQRRLNGKPLYILVGPRDIDDCCWGKLQICSDPLSTVIQFRGGFWVHGAWVSICPPSCLSSLQDHCVKIHRNLYKWICYFLQWMWWCQECPDRLKREKRCSCKRVVKCLFWAPGHLIREIFVMLCHLSAVFFRVGCLFSVAL